MHSAKINFILKSIVIILTKGNKMTVQKTPAPVTTSATCTVFDEAINKMCKKHEIVIGPDFRREIKKGVSTDPKNRDKALKTLEHRLVTMYENNNDSELDS